MLMFFQQAGQVWQAGHEHEINSNVFSDAKNKEPDDDAHPTPLGEDVELEKEQDEEPGGAAGGSGEGAVSDPLDVGNEEEVITGDQDDEDNDDDDEEEEDDEEDAEADDYLNKFINKGGEVS